MPRQGAPGVNVQMLFAGDGVKLGRFTCRLSDPLWKSDNYIGDKHHIVFPSTPVRIRQQDTRAILADPNLLILYDPGKIYTRHPASDAGDVCTFLMVDEGLLLEAAQGVGLSTTDDFSFPNHFAPSSPRTYLIARLLTAYLRRTPDPDPLLVEERLFDVVHRVMADAASFNGYRGSVSERLKAEHRDLVEAVREVLNEHITDRLSLGQIGRKVASSPYHLARLFRLHMRSSIHLDRQSLRSRYSLERVVQDRQHVYEIAMEAGYSSASHLAGSLRRIFGLSATEIRRLSTSTETLQLLTKL